MVFVPSSLAPMLVYVRNARLDDRIYLDFGTEDGSVWRLQLLVGKSFATLLFCSIGQTPWRNCQGRPTKET